MNIKKFQGVMSELLIPIYFGHFLPIASLNSRLPFSKSDITEPIERGYN